ncbi:hypothetical protein ACH5RR_029758 [Cinchona calisaya]|uniref:Chromo domain-containing protein n=1 Tax=Cinchona calisaya TaxID=153742 RepID=A0ABD2YSM3_9GENT
MNNGDVLAPTRINPLMLVSAITVEKSTLPRDSLLYVQAKLNGIDVLATVDTGATHSFVTGWEVCRLKLELKEHGYRIKTVNSKAQPVLGVASVELTLGPWSGKYSLIAVPLDDFDLILGKEFMATNKIFPIPNLDGAMIADERCPTFKPSVFVNTNAIVGPSSRRRQAKRAPSHLRKQFEKDASKVLDHRTMGQSKKNHRTDYLIHWKGETESDATWEREVTLWQFEDHIVYWEAQKAGNSKLDTKRHCKEQEEQDESPQDMQGHWKPSPAANVYYMFCRPHTDTEPLPASWHFGHPDVEFGAEETRTMREVKMSLIMRKRLLMIEPILPGRLEEFFLVPFLEL